MRGFFRRPSPAMVVACLALFVALTGTSVAVVAAMPANSVGTAQLKNNAVISTKVKNRSLKAVDFATGQLPRGQIGPAGPAGPAGPKGEKGDKGADAGTTVVLRQANGAGVSNGGVSLATANCNSGEHAIAGGVGWVGNGIGVVQGSMSTGSPGSAPTGWVVAVRNIGGATVTAVSTVICASP
jgi:hypothetical protein